MSTRPLPILVGVLAMPLGLAQQPASSGPYAIAFRAANTLEQTTRIVSGEFNSDAVLDFAMLQGQKVSIAFDPGFVEASILLPGSYRDIACHSRTGNAGSANLLTVGSSGLETGSWDHGLNQFVMADAIDSATYPILHGVWTGATMIRTGDIDGDGVPDLVGVGSDLKTLLLAASTPSGFAPPTGGFSMVQAADDVLDVTVMDHDDDGYGEILVLSKWGLELFDSDLTLLHTYEASANSGFVETVQDLGGGAERAAWLRPMPNGNRELWILNGQPFGVDQVLDVTAFSASNITSGRFDDNDSTDIAMTDSSGAAIRILKQRTIGTFAFTSNDMRTIVIDDLPATDLMTPTAFGDIDADGDLDVLAARSRASAIVIGRNDTFDHVASAPRILEMTAQEGPQIWTTQEGTEEELHIRFEAPHFADAQGQPLEYTHAHPAGATHLDVMVWKSTEQPDGSFLTDATAIERKVIPLLDAKSTLHEGTRFMQVDIGHFEGWNSVNGVQYVTCRYVELGASNATLYAFAHNSLYFLNSTDPLTALELQALPFTFGEYELFDTDPWYLEAEPDGGGVGDESHTGNGSTNCVPDVVPDDAPDSVPPQEQAGDPTPPST